MQTTLPRDETSFVFGPDGLLLLAPLPGGRWLTFQDLEETVETVSAEEVVTRIEARLCGRWQPTDVTWFSPFRMHRRIASRGDFLVVFGTTPPKARTVSKKSE